MEITGGKTIDGWRTVDDAAILGRLEPAARALRGAVEQTLADGATTPDLGGRLTTTQVADQVMERLAATGY